MATHLTIDEGNSSTKTALWRDGVMQTEHTCRPGELDDIARLAGVSTPVDAAIFCSVCGRDRDAVARVLAPLARKVIVLDASVPLPVKLAYSTPSTLGADRIAAAAGAAALSPGCDCLIVDMGTAITYDYLRADGTFIGGNIAPGVFVRLEALQHFTKALPLVETDGDVPRWGYSTETALRAGAIRGVVGELQYYRHALPRDARVFLTGGSAHLIIPYVTSPIIVEPNLVLTGLDNILQYNENQ